MLLLRLLMKLTIFFLEALTYDFSFINLLLKRSNQIWNPNIKGILYASGQGNIEQL